MHALSIVLLVATLGQHNPQQMALLRAAAAPAASGIVDWSGSGSATWYGAPAPTVDCVAAASGGDLVCTGATVTKHGTPTTVAAYGLPVQNAVALNGTTDYYDLGPLDSPTGSFTTCASFEVVDTAGVARMILSKANSISLYTYGDLLYFQIAKVGGASPYIAGNGFVGKTWSVACVSYEYVADGSSVMRMNVNGAAATPITDAAGPVAPNTNSLWIGSDGTYPWNGDLARVSIFYGWAASASQLAQMVASQQAKLTKKPAGSLVSFTSDGGLCCPSGDGSPPCFWLPANVPCVGAGGTVINRASSNLIANSVDMRMGFGSWSLGVFGNWAAQTLVPNAATAPDGTMTAVFLTNISASSNAIGAVVSATPGGTYTLSAWIKTSDVLTPAIKFATGTDGVLSRYNLGGDMTCSPTLVADQWSRCWINATLTGGENQLELDLKTEDEDFSIGRTFYAWGAQIEPGITPTLYHATTGIPYAGSATVASVDLTASAAAWCVGFRGTMANWGSVGDQLWGMGTHGSCTSRGLITYQGSLYLNGYTDACAPWQWGWQGGFAPGSMHSVAVCGAPTVRVWNDGIEQVFTSTPTGVSTYYIGPLWLESQFGSALPGAISKVCQGNTYAQVARCLQ